MENVGIALLVAAVLLGIIGFLSGRKTREMKRQIRAETATSAPRAELDVVEPRPQVAEFHVRGEEALVTFDVPLARGEIDEVMSDLLLREAVEVVREKRHSLPIDQVHVVVALAGDPANPRRVGKLELETPGVLPPPVNIPSMLHFSSIGYDPLDSQFEEGAADHVPGVAERSRTEELRPIGDELRLPKAVDVGLRAQGIDPDTMNSGELVRGMLALFGYMVTAADKPGTYFADKGGQRTYLREEPHTGGAYPELDESVMRAFQVDFMSSGAARGMLVTDKYAPFEVYERERRDPRVRYVTRERLQKFVDALSLE